MAWLRIDAPQELLFSARNLFAGVPFLCRIPSVLAWLTRNWKCQPTFAGSSVLILGLSLCLGWCSLCWCKSREAGCLSDQSFAHLRVFLTVICTLLLRVVAINHGCGLFGCFVGFHLILSLGDAHAKEFLLPTRLVTVFRR